MSEQITVTWSGREVELTLEPEGSSSVAVLIEADVRGHDEFEFFFLQKGRKGPNSDGEEIWWAQLSYPIELNEHSGYGFAIYENGATAQEALDKVAARLVAAQSWINRVLSLQPRCASPAGPP